jgi:putative hydrolase of the HAD superfamily
MANVKALLLDIGGVLLSKGWGRESRKLAAAQFGLDYDEMRDRHDVVSHLYEEGRISLDEYLHRVVFYCRRDFTPDEFKTFMFAQSKPYPEALRLFAEVKARHCLKVVALSNEGREITEHRIEAFDLGSLMDFFVVSCFVHTSKPDPAIYSFAMDQVQLCRAEVVYVDDTPILTEAATEMGIPTILHVDCARTAAVLAGFGL